MDTSAFIANRTRDFTGREWGFAEIDRRLAALDCGGTAWRTHESVQEESGWWSAQPSSPPGGNVAR